MTKSDAKCIVPLLLLMTFAAVLGWVARGRYEGGIFESTVVLQPTGWSRATSGRPVKVSGRVSAGLPGVVPSRESVEPLAPPDLLAKIASVTPALPPLRETNDVATLPRDSDAPRPIIIPVAGVARSEMRDMFNAARADHRHEAIDILAARGTPVIAADDGIVKKLFTSVAGGLTVYQFDPDERFCYYYAHLDRYADGLYEGRPLRRGEILGYVGTTGNAPENTPHLHFALIRLDPDKRWWKGTYINPYPLLAEAKSP